MEGVQVVGNSQCSVAFREQYSLHVSRRSVSRGRCVCGGANVRSPFVEHAQPNRRHATFTRRTGGVLHHRLPRHDTALSYSALAGASSTGLMGYAGLRWAESRTFPPPPSSSRIVVPSRQLPPSRSHHRGTPVPRTCDLNPNTHPFNGPLPGTT